MCCHINILHTWTFVVYACITHVDHACIQLHHSRCVISHSCIPRVVLRSIQSTGKFCYPATVPMINVNS